MNKSLFLDKTDNIFLRKPTQQEQLLHSPELQGYFYFKDCKNQIQNFLCQLHGTLIVLRETEDTPISAVMDVKNAFVKTFSKVILQGKAFIGIRFFKKGVYEDVYSKSKT